MKTGEQRKSKRKSKAYVTMATTFGNLKDIWGPSLKRIWRQRFVSKNSKRKQKRYGPGSQSESAGAIAQ